MLGRMCRKIFLASEQLQASAASKYSFLRTDSTSARVVRELPGMWLMASASTVFIKPEPNTVAMVMVSSVPGMD